MDDGPISPRRVGVRRSRPAKAVVTSQAAFAIVRVGGPMAHGKRSEVEGRSFVHDTCANGQKLHCLTIVDEWTHESLAIDVAGSIRSGRVLEVLAKLVSVRGNRPATTVTVRRPPS